MSENDKAGKAALDALKSKKNNPRKKAPSHERLPQKGSAEAEVHRLAAEERKAREKTGASASPATGSSTGTISAAGNDNSIVFLSLALLLPLFIVAGLYAFAASQQTRKPAPVQKAEARKAQPKTPETKQAGATGKQTEHAATPPAPQGASKSAPRTAAETATGQTPPATAGVAPKAVSDKPHWGYDGETGPAKWAALNPAFATCGSGQTQSPIDIPAGKGPTGPQFQYNYRPSGGKIHNTGHSVQVNILEGGELLVNGEAFALKKFHFHTPSENRFNGKSFPMEVQLVHQSAKGQLAVVAVMVEEGGHNWFLSQMPVPAKGAPAIQIGGPHINLQQLLPPARGYYTFAGSLTTPPCTENVGWIVMKQPVQATPETIAKFAKTMGRNSRPAQALNGRTIYSSAW